VTKLKVEGSRLSVTALTVEGTVCVMCSSGMWWWLFAEDSKRGTAERKTTWSG
jgi:hypothetical protein